MWLASHSSTRVASLDYDHLLSHFGVLRIDTRLAMRDLTFLHSVFAGRVDSMSILSMFSLAVPARTTRSRCILHCPTPRVDTIKNGFLCRLPRRINELYSSVPGADLFSARFTFKKMWDKILPCGNVILVYLLSYVYQIPYQLVLTCTWNKSQDTIEDSYNIFNIYSFFCNFYILQLL